MTVAAMGDAPTRVLVVDDAVVVRRMVARAIERDPALALAGIAPNGKRALEQIERLRPDVVVLDLEMPVMDGFETLAVLARTMPSLPVIVFSAVTAGSATLEALAAGATDFVVKPRADGIGLTEDQLSATLLPRIKALAVPRRTTPEVPPVQHRSASEPAVVSAVVIAASTGGPNALADILPVLEPDLAVPVFVVQHMPPNFTALLAERLDRLARVPVYEAVSGQPVVPGHVYVARGGRHMALARGGDDNGVRIALNDSPPENSCRPAADVLFRSAAAIYGAGTLGVVLTGMGQDGRQGAGAIRAAGGTVIAQDAASAVVASMPAAVVEAGLADAVVSLDAIGDELVRRVARGRRS